MIGLMTKDLLDFYKANGIEYFLPKKEEVISYNRNWMVDVSIQY